MLVLGRQKDERIYAGPVIITVVGIRGDKVRLGIEAPPEVPIYREEVVASPAFRGVPPESWVDRESVAR